MIRAVAGFDATVSAPKSLSVLWALTGDVGFAECHDVAVQVVLNHVERFGSATRVRSNGGRLHPDSNGLIVAGFRQTTSRADDGAVMQPVSLSTGLKLAVPRVVVCVSDYPYVSTIARSGLQVVAAPNNCQ